MLQSNPCTMQFPTKPLSLNNMLQLRSIALSNNSLTGTLPDSWGSLKHVSTPSSAFQPTPSILLRASQDSVKAPLSGLLCKKNRTASGSQILWLLLNVNFIVYFMHPLHCNTQSLATVVRQSQECLQGGPAVTSSLHLCTVLAAAAERAPVAKLVYNSCGQHSKSPLIKLLCGAKYTKCLYAEFHLLLQLVTMDLADNIFSGTLPSSWAGLTEASSSSAAYKIFQIQSP